MTKRKNIALKIRDSDLRDRIIERYFAKMTAAGFDISNIIRQEIENSLRHRGLWDPLESEVMAEIHGKEIS